MPLDPGFLSIWSAIRIEALSSRKLARSYKNRLQAIKRKENNKLTPSRKAILDKRAARLEEAKKALHEQVSWSMWCPPMHMMLAGSQYPEQLGQV